MFECGCVTQSRQSICYVWCAHTLLFPSPLSVLPSTPPFPFFLFSCSHPCPAILLGWTFNHFLFILHSLLFPASSSSSPSSHTPTTAPSLVCQHCFPLLERVFQLYTTLDCCTLPTATSLTRYVYVYVIHCTSHTVSTD